MDSLSRIWEKLQSANAFERLTVFLEFCDLSVGEMGKALPRGEDVAYNVCRAIFVDGLDSHPLAEAIISHACDMEIPRETKWGAGLRLDEDWRQETADAHKKREYGALLRKIEALRKEILG